MPHVPKTEERRELPTSRAVSTSPHPFLLPEMISEVVNALFITYVATEYSLASERQSPLRNSLSTREWYKSRTNLIGLAVVAIINILDRVSGASVFINEVFQGILHAPKIFFCAIAYLVSLYVDCRRVLPTLTFATFSKHVGVAFCRVAPIYPFLAVVISFVFMFVISLFEHLHLPLNWLNPVIYYGTLYGPFSYMYLIVKKRVIQDYYSLPTATTNNTGYYVSNDELLASADGAEPVTTNPSLQAAMKRRQQHQALSGQR